MEFTTVLDRELSGDEYGFTLNLATIAPNQIQVSLALAS